MSNNQFFSNSKLSPSRCVRAWWFWTAIAMLAIAIAGTMTSTLAKEEMSTGKRVSGAGKTIIEGGTGGTAPVPVTTTVAFHADAQGGDFECLALAPPVTTGRSSGQFSVNVMYVTGKVTSLEVGKDTAVLHGVATVTGLGAGHDRPFTASVREGGAGATVTLEVSGLTFNEILLEGHITID
jgi:hypothetical protein